MTHFTGKDKYDDFLIEKLEITFPITNLVHRLTYERLRSILIEWDEQRTNNTAIIPKRGNRKLP